MKKEFVQKLRAKLNVITEIFGINFKAAYYGVFAETMPYSATKEFLRKISNLCLEQKDISGYAEKLKELGLEEVTDLHAARFIFQAYLPVINKELEIDTTDLSEKEKSYVESFIKEIKHVMAKYTDEDTFRKELNDRVEHMTKSCNALLDRMENEEFTV